MRKKITFLLLSLTMVLFNVSAQYTTDGVYTIECVGTSKFMTNPGSLGAIITMQTVSSMFYIVKNGDGYNIITSDNMFLAASDGAKGVLILNTLANRNSATSGALVNFIDQGANPYRFESESSAGLKGWNGQRGGDTQVGNGTTAGTKYQWNLSRTSDLPAADAIAPTAPTNFAAVLGTKELSWTEGTDAVGVKKTYVLRATNTAATVPVFTQQDAYAVNNVIGDWTVIAVVDAGTTTFTDATAVESTDYLYAIVHNDLALNNSEALVSSTVNYTSTSVDRNSVNNFEYISNANGIEFRSLKQGAELSIYSMTGAKVYGQIIENSNLSVNLSKGIYMVRVADKVSKVIVK